MSMPVLYSGNPMEQTWFPLMVIRDEYADLPNVLTHIFRSGNTSSSYSYRIDPCFGAGIGSTMMQDIQLYFFLAFVKACC